MPLPKKLSESLEQELKLQAEALGFDVCGIASAQEVSHKAYFMKWLQEGKHAEMGWLARNPNLRTDPRNVLEGCKSVVVLGTNYYQPNPDRRGKISKYALGKDYHEILPQRVRKISDWMQNQGGHQRAYTDTGPVMEKVIAELSGIGWQGKSTILIHRRKGTWLFLSTILTTLDLEADVPEKNHCGSCERCIHACPTDAITAPYQLDARRCIAYLTIEHPGSIPMEFREAIGDRLFGCDDCLDVCPWNKWAQQTREAAFTAIERPDLREMLQWDEQTFRNAFRKTPVFRLKWHRWIRNICVVLGNIGELEDVPAVERIADAFPDDMVREHACWAINRIKLRATDNL
ncbi:MAG: tRNA epoxyqueuosine(34) reductase QueG [Verrucomicrobiota bacterium]